MEEKIMPTQHENVGKTFLDKRTFQGCRFDVCYPTKEALVEWLSAYLDERDFSGPFRFREDAMTYQPIHDSQGKSLLCQDWNCSIIEAVITRQVSDGVTVISETLQDFIDQWGSGTIADWSRISDPREKWGEEPEIICNVFIVEDEVWYNAIQEVKNNLRLQASENFRLVWDTEIIDDDEQLFNLAYDNAMVGRSKYYVPSTGEVECQIMTLQAKAVEAQSRQSKTSFEDALNEYLHGLNLI